MFEPMWFFLVFAVFVAGLVRGYAGFGFAAIAVVGLNLFLDPQQSVPIVLSLDVLCSVMLVKQAVQQADISTFKLLTSGSLVGIPAGLVLILLLPSEILKLGICILILFICLFLALDIRFKGTDKAITKFGFGLVAGAGTSGSSVGGPMIVCYMISSSLSSAKQRGTMILFFVISESIALIALAVSGLFDLEVLKLIIVLLVPTLLAVRLGQALFNRFQPSSFKPIALPILVLVSLLGILASVRELF